MPQPTRRITTNLVMRLNVYARELAILAAGGTRMVSSDLLAQRSGVTAATVRSDLTTVEFRGTRGVGYAVGELLKNLTGLLGLDRAHPVVVVGAGRLGQALANYLQEGRYGLLLIALVDTDDRKIGTTVGDIRVTHPSELLDLQEQCAGALGVIAVPAAGAQYACNALVDAGFRSILNFAPQRLAAPATVAVRSIDFAVELRMLGFFEEHDELRSEVLQR